MIVEVPIRIESTLNKREHYMERSRRNAKHKNDVYFGLKAAKAPHQVPCVVTLTRVAPRELDGDNLQAGCKGSRDAVALWLAVDDADKRIEWRYAQQKRGVKDYSLLVEIVPAVAA
jgi:hypothetical protein